MKEYKWYQHIGVYSYRPKALLEFVNEPPTKLEKLEQLEQLRAQSLGFKIGAIVSEKRLIGVDTPEDIIIEYSDKYLSSSDIKLPKGIIFSEEDSLKWIEDAKKQWLLNQIIIEKSIKDLPSSELNIENDLLQYKADLLRYKYENYFIKNKIKTQVSSSEIKDFYQKNKKALKSSKTLVKAIYIEVRNTVKDRYKIKQW